MTKHIEVFTQNSIRIQPKVAIPVHYGSIVGKPEDAKTFASLVKPPVQVEIKIR